MAIKCYKCFKVIYSAPGQFSKIPASLSPGTDGLEFLLGDGATTGDLIQLHQICRGTVVASSPCAFQYSALRFQHIPAGTRRFVVGGCLFEHYHASGTEKKKAYTETSAPNITIVWCIFNMLSCDWEFFLPNFVNVPNTGKKEF